MLWLLKTRALVDDLAHDWQAYNVELRQCLVSLSCSLEEHVESRMHQLALEALRLVGCRISLNPAVHKALVNGRGSLGQVALHQLDRTFYTSLLVSHRLLFAGHLLNQ